MLQAEIAVQIGADKKSICNWENNLIQPGVRFIPKIIKFVGYNPLPPVQNLAEQIARCRKTLGLSQEQLAKYLGVDEGTVANWESGRRKPKGKYLELIRGWFETERYSHSSTLSPCIFPGEKVVR